MARRRRSPESRGTTPPAAAYNPVFIDTNLGTHLALIISHSETIADLKDQLVLEHGRFFPDMGVVKVHAVKMQQRGAFYHLPDYMLVKSAFEGDSTGRFLFLSVDVSKCHDVLQLVDDGPTNQRDLTTTNLLVQDQGHLQDDCFKIPCAVDGVQVAHVQNGSSSKHQYNIPASNQEFKDDNVPNNVSNLGSGASGQSAETCNSAKKLKRKHNSLVAISVSKKLKRNSYSHHDPEVNRTGELNFAQDGLENPGELALPSASSDTKEVNVHKRRGKKRAKSSKSKFLDDHDDYVRNVMADSHLALPDTANQELPESAKFEKGRLFLGKPDVTAAGHLGSSGISHLHDDMLKLDSKNKTEERKLSTVDDPEMMQTEELDLLHCKSTVPSASLVAKAANTHEKSRKKRSTVSRSGVQDEHVDRPGLQDVAASDHHCCESTIKEGIFSSKVDVRDVEQNLLTKTVDTDEGTEGLNCVGEKKKKKVRKSDARSNNQENGESNVAENDLNLEQNSETLLSSNLDCPDVPKSLEVNEAIEDGKATKKKQEAENTAARVQDSGDMNRHADQISDVGAVEQSPLTKTVDIDEATEGVNCGGKKKKKKKVRKSGAGAKDRQNRESIVAENDLNLEHVPETQLSSNSDHPDVPVSFGVSEAIEDGKATDEKKKKQEVENTVARVRDTGHMNQHADQISDVEAVEQNPLTKTVDTDEATEGVNCGIKKNKKKKKVQKPGAGAKDQQNRESIVTKNDMNLEQVPETQISSNSDCPDVPKTLEENEATEDGKATHERNIEQKAEKAVARVQDTGEMNQDADQINDVRDVDQNPLTKSVDTDEATEGANWGDKKKTQVRKSGAAAKDEQNRESIVAENDLNLEEVPETQMSDNSDCPDVPKASEVNEATEEGKPSDGNKKKQKEEKAVTSVQDTDDMNLDARQINDVRAVKQNRSTKPVDTDATEGVNCGGEKKKKKARKSGGAKDGLNLEQVPEKGLSTNSNCPDVPKALEVNEATEDGKAIEEYKKKQMVEKAVAESQDTGDMNRDADQINSPSVDSPKPADMMPPSENAETYQTIEERVLLVNNNSERIVLSRDIPSFMYQNEPLSGTVSNTNTSTATVTEEQKKRGTRIKKRARKTVSSACQNGMDTEKTPIRTGSSSAGWNMHADVQVEKNKDLLPVSTRIEAPAGILADTSKGKNTPPMGSHLIQVSAELENQKDGEVSKCIGEEINFKQAFVRSHPQDEVTPEESSGSVTKKKRKEVVPSAVSAPKLQQDFPESTKKDSIYSSAGKADNLAESNRVANTKKKTGKRGVPYATTSSDLDEFRTPSKPVSSSFLNGSDATKKAPRKKETVKSLAASGVNSSSKTYGKPPLKNTRDRKESSLRPHVTTGKNSSSKLDGEVVNKSKQEKNLGQTPKSIFRDDSSESSLGENGSVDSSASTGPPSDLSSSSDLSEDAATNGGHGKAKGGVKKSVSNSEHIPLGTILKSSRRFKKAKLTASQQFEDPESQIGEFLPDTQLFP